MEEQEKIEDLIIHFFEGKTTPEENEKIECWKNANESNVDLFNELRNTWYASLSFDVQKLPDIEDEYRKLHQRIFTRSALTYLKPIAIAASLVAAVFLGIGINHYSSEKETIWAKTDTIRFESIKGSMSVVTLPDGTKIWVNADSRIAYDTEYNTDKRIVELDGEAYFDVVTNPQKPFIVKAKGIEVKATGTIFNVKAYSGEPNVTTTLVEGILHIQGKGKDNRPFNLEVKPHQTVTYFTADQIKKEDMAFIPVNINVEKIKEIEKQTIPAFKEDDINTKIYTSWKDKRWIVENDKLSILKGKLERRYNVRIIFQDEELGNYRFSGSFESETIEGIMQILKFTIPINYEIEKGVITMSINHKTKKLFDKANLEN